MGKIFNTLFSFLIGSIVGAIFGLLYAPDKGVSTREKLIGHLSKYKSLLQEYVNNLSANVMGSEDDKAASDTKKKAQKLLTDVDDLLTKMRTEKK